MRTYIIGNDDVALCRKTPAKVTDGEIVVVFCDLRGYTAFTETAEPEEVLDFSARVPRRSGSAR